MIELTLKGSMAQLARFSTVWEEFLSTLSAMEEPQQQLQAIGEMMGALVALNGSAVELLSTMGASAKTVASFVATAGHVATDIRRTVKMLENGQGADAPTTPTKPTIIT